MLLSRRKDEHDSFWTLDGRRLPEGFSLGFLLELPKEAGRRLLSGLPTTESAGGRRLAPIEPYQEVWASGVTYMKSREARMAESASGDIYQRVYLAERPELFSTALGWRVRGAGTPVRIRKDSDWNVPEPELVLVLNSRMEIMGFTAGNDMSSRDIEGENPLYLPQAKVYDGSCALGPDIVLADVDELRELPIRLEVVRDGETVFEGETNTSQMKRSLEELAHYLGREMSFPQGAFLMTGTGIVPPDSFTLLPDDEIRVSVGQLVLQNRVEQ